MYETCGDNRFEVIEAAKKRLCQATNIEESPTEWAVLDSFLFRMWQMGWLPGCEHSERTCEGCEYDGKQEYCMYCDDCVRRFKSDCYTPKAVE